MPTPNSSNVKFGLITEATEGTLETGTAVPLVLNRSAQPSFDSNMLVDDSVTGDAQILDADPNFFSCSVAVQSYARYNDSRPLWVRLLRTTTPSAVKIVGSSDIDVVTGGTHQDSSTGAQIQVADTSSFDDLINYHGATSSTHPAGGAAKLLVKVSGFTGGATDNNGYREIKAVWKDGSNSYIDISPSWVAGSAGFAAAPMIAATGISATLDVGIAFRNRNTGFAASSVTSTGLWDFTDMGTTLRYQGARGLFPGQGTLQWTGKGGVEFNVDFEGYAQSVLSGTDPTGSGHSDSALEFSPMLHAGSLLKHFIISTATTPLIMSGLNVTGFSSQINGNLETEDDVSGTQYRTGMMPGSHDVSGQISYNVKDNAIVASLAALGDPTSKEKASIDSIWEDGLGNACAFRVLKASFGQTGAQPQGQNTRIQGVPLTYQAMADRKKISGVFQENRTCVWQEWGA